MLLKLLPQFAKLSISDLGVLRLLMTFDGYSRWPVQHSQANEIAMVVYPKNRYIAAIKLEAFCHGQWWANRSLKTCFLREVLRSLTVS